MRDDLPAPDGPIMAVSSPERNSPDIDFRMVFGPAENKKFEFQKLQLKQNKNWNEMFQVLFFLFFSREANQGEGDMIS